MEPSSDHTAEIQRCLERLQAGDRAARESLFDFARQRLYRLCHAMLKDFPVVGRFEQTDDVLQEAAIRMERALAAESPRSVEHFLKLAALQIRWTLIDLLRRHAGSAAHGGPVAVDGRAADPAQSTFAPQLPQEHTDGPATLAEWTEFHRAVEQLPPEEREVFDLHFYAGIALKDAARQLGISERTITRRWRNARLLLHKSLNKL